MARPGRRLRSSSRLQRPTSISAPAAPSLQQQTIQVYYWPTTDIARSGAAARDRRSSRSSLPLVIVAPAQPSQQQQTIVVSLRAIQRSTPVSRATRPAHWKLGAPIFLPLPDGTPAAVETRLTAVASRLATVVRRQSKSRLLRPALIQAPPAPALALQAITAKLAALGRATAAARDPRIAHSRLAPPIFLPLPDGTPQTIQIRLTAVASRLASAVRRAARSHLDPPIFLPLPDGTPQTIRTTLISVQASGARGRVRRPANSALSRPVIIVTPPAPSLRQQTVRITLAGRTRLERLERPARSKLRRPVVVTTPPAPSLGQQKLTIRLATVPRLSVAIRARRTRPQLTLYLSDVRDLCHLGPAGTLDPYALSLAGLATDTLAVSGLTAGTLTSTALTGTGLTGAALTPADLGSAAGTCP